MARAVAARSTVITIVEQGIDSAPILITAEMLAKQQTPVTPRTLSFNVAGVAGAHLAMWHIRIEAWMLEEAGIEQPKEITEGLRLVK
jgi:hypothetical protein